MTPKKRAPSRKSAKAKKATKRSAATPVEKASAKPARGRPPKASAKAKPAARNAKARAKTKGASSTVVEKGARAPDFALATDQGGEVTLSGLRGKKVVLYFYPKDDTPGCTIQACDFRDAQPTFEGLDAVVLGVSADSVDSHAKFRAKFGLNFPLLADVDATVSMAYGVWKEKSMYGRTFMGIERSTFLIDEDGIVVEAWRKVSPQGHADMLAEVLAG